MSHSLIALAMSWKMPPQMRVSQLLVFREVLGAELMEMATGGNTELKANPIVRCTLLLLLTLACSVGVWFGCRFWSLAAFANNRDVGLQSIEALRLQRPSDVSIASWEVAVNWTTTAYLNVFSSLDNPTSDDLEVFVEDLDRMTNRRVDLQTIQTLWERLARSGPYGKEYVDRFYPEFQRSFDEVAVVGNIEGDRTQ